jgi:hypothetical protein
MAEAVTCFATHDWGVPDPRDVGAYPSATAATPMTQWAWEFLRRREDYRRRWERLNRDRGHKEICETEDEDGPVRKVHWQSPLEALRREFRICASRVNSTLDPCNGQPPVFEGAEVVYEIEEQHDELVLPRVGIEYDVSLPLRPQIDAARALLAQKAKEWSPLPQSKEVKPQTAILLRDLRLLDFAAESGVSDNEIGRYLFSNKSGDALRDNINKATKSALGWQDKYLRIALRSPAAS